MKRSVNSAQLGIRLIHLTIDGDNETFGGEDQRLVESVSKAGDVVTVKLKGFARPRGGRNIAVGGLFLAGASPQEYAFTSSDTEDINLTTQNTGVHGTFGLLVVVNDSKNLYDK